MRFTSLVVELIRARPGLVVWLVVLLQAALWLILPTLLYRSPPGELATVLAFGREYQVGTSLGPPLAFWLADIAYRAVGNHVFGVYLLAQICAVVTFWSFYKLARAVVLAMPPLPAIDDLSARAMHWGGLLGALVLAMAGIVLLVVLNSGWFARNAEEAPIIYRPPVDPLAREFVYCCAIGPALGGSLAAGLFNLERISGGPGVALLMSGLAVIVATGDLVYLRRQRLLRSVWAAAVAAPAFLAIR